MRIRLLNIRPVDKQIILPLEIAMPSLISIFACCLAQRPCVEGKRSSPVTPNKEPYPGAPSGDWARLPSLLFMFLIAGGHPSPQLFR